MVITRPRAATSGTATASATSTSARSWSSPTSATSTRGSSQAIQEQAAHLCTVAPAVANGARSEAARLIAEPHAGRPGPRLLHQRRRRRQRARRPHGAPAHGPAQGAHDLPLLPRRHAPRGQHDRRPAPLGQRPRLGRHGPLLRPLPLPQRRSTRPPRTRSASAPSSTSSRWSRSRGPAPSRPSCSRPSRAPPASWCRRPATSRASARSATGTASCSSPTR